jgi:hypothetical protein
VIALAPSNIFFIFCAKLCFEGNYVIRQNGCSEKKKNICVKCILSVNDLCNVWYIL